LFLRAATQATILGGRNRTFQTQQAVVKKLIIQVPSLNEAKSLPGTGPDQEARAGASAEPR
jgi:hypothetical protein